MPPVHDAHPTAALDHIDISLVRDWIEYPGGKLLALPFENEANDINLYDGVKDKIFTAITEITTSMEIGVSAPKPSQEAEKAEGTPSAFLIYNLTDSHCTTLLQRRVWSSTTITFRVIELNPPSPDFLFTLQGFSTMITSDILTMVRAVWRHNDIANLINAISKSFSEDAHAEVKASITAFLDSVTIARLDIKSSGDTLQPHFNVYANGSIIGNDDLWIYLCEYLATRIYASPMQGLGTTKISPYHCGLCHSVDHPRGLCPFPVIPGWNGPGTRPTTISRRGRGGRARGFNTHGRH